MHEAVQVSKEKHDKNVKDYQPMISSIHLTLAYPSGQKD